MTAAQQEATGSNVTESDVLLAARQASRASFVFGIVLVSLGVLAIMAPLFTGVATAVLVGMLLIAGGITESVFAFRAPSFGKGLLTFLFGGLAVAAGLVTLGQPGRGLGALTMVLAAYFVASGVVDIVLALRLRPQEGWGWALSSGIVSIALGALILADWPVSGMWAVGVYVGVRLLMHGWMLMALGTTGSDALAYVRDQRIESLERHVRAGLGALQETQIALVAHTAMILALDSGLRQEDVHTGRRPGDPGTQRQPGRGSGGDGAGRGRWRRRMGCGADGGEQELRSAARERVRSDPEHSEGAGDRDGLRASAEAETTERR